MTEPTIAPGPIPVELLTVVFLGFLLGLAITTAIALAIILWTIVTNIFVFIIMWLYDLIFKNDNQIGD